MTTYAQKDFHQIQGNNGVHTIAEIGSLLVAFCNLLSRFGVDVSPADLNTTFIEDGIFLDRTDDVRDRLAFSSVSAFDSTIGVSGHGSGIAPFDYSIVRLDYESALTNTTVSTYAVVVDHENGIIIDSYDGEEKSWTVYGVPVEWFSYAQFRPVTIFPLKAPSKPASELTAEIVPEATSQPETSPDEPQVAENEDGSTTIPVHVDATPWVTSFVPSSAVLDTVTLNESLVRDYSGVNEDKSLPAGAIVHVAGHFVVGGITYARTKKSVDENHWYGVPVTNLKYPESYNEEKLDADLDGFLSADKDDLKFELGDDRLSAREKLIKVGATVDGKLDQAKKLLTFRKK